MTRDETILYAASSAAAVAIGFFLWRWDVIRPDSFPPRRNRDVSGAPTVIWLLGALLIYLGQVQGALLTALLPARVLGAPKSIQQLAIMGLGSYVAALVVGLTIIYLLRGRVSEKSGLALGRNPWYDIGRGLIAIILVVPFYLCLTRVSSEVATLVQGTEPDRLAHKGLEEIVRNRDTVWAWVLMAGAAVGAPIVEELMYRVFLQSCFLSAFGRAWPAIFLTSAIFAAAHWTAVPPHALPALFLLGLAFGLAYERTRSMLVPITMHALFNAGSLAAALLLGA